MELKTKVNKDLIMDFGGDIDKTDTDGIAKRIEEDLFLYQGVKKVILNFEDVDYIHHSALNIIGSYYKRLKEEEKQLIIKNPSEEVEEFIKLLVPYIPIEQSYSF